MVALSAAVLGATGCGGGSDAPAPPPAAAPTAAAPAGGAAPVADRSSGGGNAGIGMDIEAERVESKRALRTWGKSAERACRKAQRKVEPWYKRIKRLGTPKSEADIKRFGRAVVDLGRAAEYEYELLRDIAQPAQPSAIDAVYSFFDKEEEALILVQRIGIELEMLNDLKGILGSVDRLIDLIDDYQRAGRAAYAHDCVD